MPPSLAGLELVEHTPQHLYLDRYPVGRQATIWRGPNLVFRDACGAAILMKVKATQMSIAVRS